MYLRLVLLACLLAFIAVVFSAYARLSDAGLGCANWPACYEENALKLRQVRSADSVLRTHDSWQWKLQNQVGLLMGILSIAICAIAWRKRVEFRLSPLLPTLLVGLIVFLAVFGMTAFSYLPRSIIVPVHFAGGMALLILLTWIALRHMSPFSVVGNNARNWRNASRLGLVLLLIQIMLGSWVSANFAALACTGFPLCNGALLPAMDFSYSLERFGLPLSAEKLTAIHWMHRVGALLVFCYLSWLSLRIRDVEGMRTIAGIMLALLVLQTALGIANVLLDLSLVSAVLHNAFAMLLLVILVLLNFRVQTMVTSSSNLSKISS
ncbi:MAG: COX15/CtaA family protein [Gallionella sp.]|nr:COX15/CtaA family protein [Gallionella sp.]MDP1941983.1 COX15/CtaA family protein [Gallionella sp.]